MAGDQQTEIHQLGTEIAALLTQTFTPDQNVRKAAEDALLRLETSNRLYGLATLYLTCQGLSSDVHIAAAIAFKNFIRRNWPYDQATDQVDRIDPQQRDLIKQHITNFMIKAPNQIQRQLSEAITIIGKCDFPERWPTLIVELEGHLRDQNLDFNSMQGVLQTAHSIFRRYRFELESTRLWAEIKHVMQHFAEPFDVRFREIVKALNEGPQDPNILAAIYQCLLLCTQIYHSLITQDLPEYFEDTVEPWLDGLLSLLNVQDNAAAVIEMKAEICEIASLFVQRYPDADNFQKYPRSFAEHIWNLLVSTNQDVQFDTLISTAIRYMITVAERPELKTLFQNAEGVMQLCNQVILPNMKIRDVDEELFEFDPEEFVRRDIECSNSETRRGAAADLVRVLNRFLERELAELFGAYIESMNTNYETNRKTNWRDKDLAVFLYSSMASRGSTRQHGTVTISSQVNVELFFEKYLLYELESLNQDDTGSNILKVDSLKFMETFRNHISLDKLFKWLPLVLRHINSSNVVVSTYASILLEKLLTMRDRTMSNTTAFKPEHIEPHLHDTFFVDIFATLNRSESPENEHIMKAIMRLCSFLTPNLWVKYLTTIAPKLIEKLKIVARNPGKPFFNQYLLESLALTIRATCSINDQAMRNDFEMVLSAIHAELTAHEVIEFAPYVLQLLNILRQAKTA